jgi:hypothetical protein
MHLMVCTRPDIAFIVSTLSKYNNEPREIHWQAVKRVLRYIKGTKNCKLTLGGEDNKLVLRGYCDADWASSDKQGRRSVTGYVFLLGNGAISWSSRRQPTVAISTAEAEYMSLSAGTQEGLWLKSLLNTLNVMDPLEPIQLFNDNQAAIAMSKNTGSHGKNKHIDIKHHFIRCHVELKNLVITYCPTKDMLADILTKGLPREQHKLLAGWIGVRY